MHNNDTYAAGPAPGAVAASTTATRYQWYVGKEDGRSLAGDLDNRTWSGLFSAMYGANTFYIGLQKVSGRDGWMKVNGTSGGSLANDSFSSSYENANERSWQVRHDYNFVAVGVPGLVLMNRYIQGSGIRVGGETSAHCRKTRAETHALQRSPGQVPTRLHTHSRRTRRRPRGSRAN